MTTRISEKEFQDTGYLYLEEHGTTTSKIYQANQLWLNFTSWDLIIYDPDDERILRTMQKDGKFQNFQKTCW